MRFLLTGTVSILDSNFSFYPLLRRIKQTQLSFIGVCDTERINKGIEGRGSLFPK